MDNSRRYPARRTEKAFSWKKKAGSLVLILTLWSLLQGVCYNAYTRIYPKIAKVLGRLKDAGSNKVKIEDLEKRIGDLASTIEERCQAIEEDVGEHESRNKLMRAKVMGFQSVLDEQPKPKKKKKFIIF